MVKLGQNLGHYKLVRIAYKKLKNLRLPEKLTESIQIGSIEIRTKPFVDAEVKIRMFYFTISLIKFSFQQQQELSLFCYRCSTSCSLFNSKLNRCINCNQKFIHSFYSFGNKKNKPEFYWSILKRKFIQNFLYKFLDLLPLVEFVLDPKISHENFQEILSKNKLGRGNENNSATASRPNSMTIINPATNQVSDVYSNELFINNEEVSMETQQIIDLNNGIDPITNLTIFNEKQLNKLTESNVIIVRDPFNSGFRYYLNMMPEIDIVACSNCTKVKKKKYKSII